MAYTTFQKSFWADDYVLNLSRDDKLVYAYLITNDKTQQCGIYELAMKKVCPELSMRPEELLLSLKRFSDDKKICYSMETQEVCLVNWLKHNANSSWKTAESVKKQLMNIKNPQLMMILYDPREPLFDGTRKEKGVDGKYADVPYIIENPFKEYFSELSDAELFEIRAPFMGNKMKFMPLASPLHAPFTNNSNNTVTITEQNTNRTETETANDEGVEQAETKYSEQTTSRGYEKYIPPTEPTPSSKIDDSVKYWNDKTGLPKTRKMTVNLGEKAKPIMDSISLYSLDEIKSSIDNYQTIQSNQDKYKPIATYGDVFGFLSSGIEKYWDDSNPIQNMKIEKGMTEAEKIAEEFRLRDIEIENQEDNK